MGKIYYIMGKSSTGKDTIYRNLQECHGMNLSTIVSYTTRPIREGEANGVEYYFVTEAEMELLRQQGKIIESRTYHTYYGDWNYFTAMDEQIDLEQKNYLLIGTPESFVSVKKYFGEDVVVPILIELDDGVRLQRALNREKKEKYPKYEEMCRRFLADGVDFSEENITKAGIVKRFYNDDLEKCLTEIKSYIKQFSD